MTALYLPDFQGDLRHDLSYQSIGWTPWITKESLMTDTLLLCSVSFIALWSLTALGVWLSADGQLSFGGALWRGLTALVWHALRFLFWVLVGWLVAAMLSRRR